MPTYAYSCTECGHAFDAVQKFTDDALTSCPECGGRLRKVYGSIGVSFKGSGFYRNDSRAASSGAGGKSESGGKGESGGTGDKSGGASTPAASSGSGGSGGSGGTSTSGSAGSSTSAAPAKSSGGSSSTPAAS